MKRIYFRFDRICRRAGGLSLGFTFHFPCAVLCLERPDGTIRYRYMTTLSIGMLFWRFKIEYYSKPIPVV